MLGSNFALHLRRRKLTKTALQVSRYFIGRLWAPKDAGVSERMAPCPAFGGELEDLIRFLGSSRNLWFRISGPQNPQTVTTNIFQLLTPRTNSELPVGLSFAVLRRIIVLHFCKSRNRIFLSGREGSCKSNSKPRKPHTMKKTLNQGTPKAPIPKNPRRDRTQRAVRNSRSQNPAQRPTSAWGRCCTGCHHFSED